MSCDKCEHQTKVERPTIPGFTKTCGHSLINGGDNNAACSFIIADKVCKIEQELALLKESACPVIYLKNLITKVLTGNLVTGI